MALQGTPILDVFAAIMLATATVSGARLAAARLPAGWQPAGWQSQTGTGAGSQSLECPALALAFASVLAGYTAWERVEGGRARPRPPTTHPGTRGIATGTTRPFGMS